MQSLSLVGGIWDGMRTSRVEGRRVEAISGESGAVFSCNYRHDDAEAERAPTGSEVFVVSRDWTNGGKM